MSRTKAKLRAGSYGEPSLVAMAVWDKLYAKFKTGTGYTHRWRKPEVQAHKKYFMASVESIADAKQAQAKLWRTYRVDLEGIGPQENESWCPEQTHGIQCYDCGRCGGTNSPGKNIVISPIQRGKGAAKCYVNTGWLGRMYKAWKAGKLPKGTTEEWRGESPIDGAAIVMLATGQTKPSDNTKTGPMVQTFIIRQDMKPIEAVKTGKDKSICDGCKFRPILAKAAN